MRYQRWLKGGFWLTVVGLCSYIFPFMQGVGFRETLSENGLSLMLGVGELRFNGWLWLVLVAGIVCLCYNVQARREHASRQPDKANQAALVSAIAAGAGAVLLFLFRENIESAYATDYFMPKTDWGWIVALWCCLGAAACVIGAYATGGATLEEEPEQPEEPMRDAPKGAMKFDTQASQAQTKLAKLKQQYLAGEITAEEYEREIELVQKIAKELRKG